MMKETVEACGRSLDCGDKLGYLKAIVEYAMRDDKLGTDFNKFLSQVKS